MKKSKLDLKKNVPYFSFIFISILAIYFVFAMHTMDIRNDALYNKAIDEEYKLMNTKKCSIVNEITNLISDVTITRDHIEASLNSNTPISKNIILKETLLSLVQNKQFYDHIRYIDQNGEEIIRVALRDGKSILIEKNELQNKKNRYYFKTTMDLDRGQIYISKLDLNIENGEIETPRKPMIRISTKVYDKNGKCKGMVIVNYKAQILLDNFKNISKSGTGYSYLLNEEGYWISNIKDEDTEFAFMFDDKKDITFQNIDSDAWDNIKGRESTIYKNSENIYIASAISLFEEKASINDIPMKDIKLDAGKYYVVTHIDKKNNRRLFPYSIPEKLLQITEDSCFYIIAIFIFSVILSVFIQISKSQREKIKFFSEYDALTLAYNRRAGLQKLESLVALNNRTSNTICISFIDINDLKLVNDVLGHKHGDNLISETAKCIRESIRNTDFLIRYGGDEFILVLYNTNYEQEKVVWNRIIQKLNKKNENEEQPYNINISHGLSLIEGGNLHTDIKKHISEADKNMYLEKQVVKKNTVTLKNI